MSKKKNNVGTVPVPPGFISEMESTLGEDEARKLLTALEEEPSVSIRVNRRKVSREAAATMGSGMLKEVPWCGSGFYLETRPDFIHDPLLHAGVYYVQEAASMIYESIVHNLLNNMKGGKREIRILDLCAAPGGKSTAMLNGVVLAEETEGERLRYVLVANEYDRKRVKILKENLDKWGDPCVIITNSSADRFALLSDLFDIVAVDAPCSGEGMMRREPIARSQWSEKLVRQCSALQKEILGNAVTALRPGGFLIFSTCTFNCIENEQNVRWIESSLNLRLVSPPRHFFPHRDRCEGLFVALFQKPDIGIESTAGRNTGNMEKILKSAGIRILSCGIEQSVKKGALEIPSSRRVLASDFDISNFPVAELSREEALSYLRRNPIVLPEDIPAGYVAVTYKGHPLGLVKNLGPRANNLYPAEWRILS